MEKSIVVVGSINMDLVARCGRIPLPGQTVTGSDFTTTPGGKGANQAVAAARLGYPVEMVGAVGDDVFGQSLIEQLSQSGVGVASIARVGGPSGVASILVAEKGENSIVVVPGANGKVDRALIDAQAEKISAAAMVLLQLELPLDTEAYVLQLCQQAQVPVMLDPAPAAPLPERLWPMVSWLTPNETEAAFYLGSERTAGVAAESFLSKGVRGVVLKRGPEGAYVARTRQAGEWIPAFIVEAVDTVAAGDCFNAAFAVSLLRGADPATAARFASAAAAISVTRRGAQSSMPNRSEVEAFLAQNG